MSKKLFNNIKSMIESSKRKNSMSLKMLLEEEDADVFSDAFGDEGDEGEEESSEETDSDEESSEESDSAEESSEETDSEEETGSDVYDDLTALKSFTDTVKDANFAKNAVKDKYKFTPGQNITGKIVSDSYAKKYNIKDMLLLFEQDEEVENTIDKVEKSLEDEEARIEKLADKAQQISSKIKAGESINVNGQADSALKDFNNFDSLFSKAEFVANSYIDHIVDVCSPQDVEGNVKAFIDEFNSLLPDNAKLDIHDSPTSYNAMAGAKPTA